MLREIVNRDSDGKWHRNRYVKWDLRYNLYDYVGEVDVFYSLYGYPNQYGKERTIDHFILDYDTQDTSFIIDQIKNLKDIPTIVFFSGNGFHIMIPDLWGFDWKDIYNGTIKNTLMKKFPYADNIYDSRRVIRCPGTINSKSGLYKNVVYPEELEKGYDYVKSIFSKLDTSRLIESTKIDAFNKCNIRLNKVYSVGKPIVVKSNTETLFSPKCIFKLINSGPIKGQRHITSMRIASHLLHYMHLPINMTIAAIHNWWGDMSDKELEDLDRTIRNVKEKYRYGCNDVVLKAHCENTCAYWTGKDYMGTFTGLVDGYNLYVKMIDENQYIDLDSIYPAIGSRFRIFNNDLVGIVGSPGTGKSTMAMDIALRMINNNPDTLVVWSNIDQSNELLIRRFVQWKLTMTVEQAENKQNYNSATNVLRKLQNNVKLSNIATIEEIEKNITEWKDKGLRKKPDLWIIDHVGNLQTNMEGYERMRYIGKRLKAIPKDTNTMVVAISHIPRSQHRSKILDVTSARDANLGEAADVMLGLDKTGTGQQGGKIYMDEKNPIVTIFPLKARDNAQFLFKMRFNTDYFRFEEVENEQDV